MGKKKYTILTIVILLYHFLLILLKKYAYINDSGNLLNNQSVSRIIVVDLKKDKIYRILKNNTEFEPDENIEITYSSDNELANYYTNVNILNNSQITRDGKIIYFTSSKK